MASMPCKTEVLSVNCGPILTCATSPVEERFSVSNLATSHVSSLEESGPFTMFPCVNTASIRERRQRRRPSADSGQHWERLPKVPGLLQQHRGLCTRMGDVTTS